MSLTPGTRLGPYEVTAQIGVGGMGEVYRATDTNLRRQVAIKVLPDIFARDPERLARFEREAEVLASLNHPNIAQIHGLERRRTASTALVMELVEGPTLADRIAQGAIPVDEALPIAKQIAEAPRSGARAGHHPSRSEAREHQGAAGRHGQSARLRPGEGDGAGRAGCRRACRSRRRYDARDDAGVGMILGTAAYMSPEQARGKPVDKRADIWAFGCVLFEMLTGQRAFAGDDVQETFVAIMRDEPDWARLPAALSPALGSSFGVAFRRIRGGACRTSATCAWRWRVRSRRRFDGRPNHRPHRPFSVAAAMGRQSRCHAGRCPLRPCRLGCGASCAACASIGAF